ncbi:MAG: hypothetical protein VCD00_03275 [Candidatus Hydrogenedentota bacterium]
MLALLLCTSIVSAQVFGPGREYRSLNTGQYHISIQKNGRVDITTSAGAPIFVDAFPMVWFAGKKKPEAVRLDGRYSQRFEVNDALGRGQGMRIRFNDIQWTLQAYPTKPYLAVQLAYINNSKKPVHIKQLIPWAIGDPRKGSVILGAGTADSIMLLDGMGKDSRALATQNGQAANMMALLNPHTGQSLIAGFTTQARAFNTVHIQSLDDEPNHFNYMRATNIYDPPATVNPGEVLESEILYLAIAESDPLLALERYAKAIAVTNRIPVYTKTPARNILVMHEYPTDEEYRAVLLDAIERIESSGAHAEQIRFIIGRPPEYPYSVSDRSLATHASLIRQHGFRVGLFGNPFEFPIQSDEVKQNPDWFVHEPTSMYSSSTISHDLLDVTNLIASSWLMQRLKERQKTIGFDSIWGIDLDLYTRSLVWNFTDSELQTDEYGFQSGDHLTKIEIARMAMATLRASVTPTTPIILNPSHLLPTFPYTGHLESHNEFSKFSYAPHLGHRYTLNRSGENELTYPQAGIMAVNLIETIETLDTAWEADTRTSIFLPPLLHPAKPRDLFLADPPAIWLKRGTETSGQWLLASIQNVHGDKTRTVTLPLGESRQRRATKYTLFDLDQQRYYGNASNQVNINVSAGQVRTLLLREFRGVPLLLGTSRSIASSTPDQLKTGWKSDTMRLHGSLTPSLDDYNIHILVPDVLNVSSVTIDSQDTPWTLSNGVASITIPRSAATNIPLEIQFVRATAE